MNLRKIFKNGICVTLLSAILFCSPVSRYMDTQQITKAEAASLEFTGVTLFYAFAQLLGYEVATTNTSMLIDEFVKFSTASQNEIASKVVETATHGLYSPDDSIEQAVLKGFISLLSEFMISASYESVDGYNDSFSERSAQISFTYAPASPSGYYYNRMPATARTALWSKFLKTMKSGLYSSDVEFLGYFSLYSEREDCFYYTDYGFNSSTDGSYKEFCLMSSLYLYQV